VKPGRRRKEQKGGKERQRGEWDCHVGKLGVHKAEIERKGRVISGRGVYGVEGIQGKTEKQGSYARRKGRRRSWGEDVGGEARKKEK